MMVRSFVRRGVARTGKEGGSLLKRQREMGQTYQQAQWQEGKSLFHVVQVEMPRTYDLSVIQGIDN